MIYPPYLRTGYLCQISYQGLFNIFKADQTE